jgi:hypothetical protein
LIHLWHFTEIKILERTIVLVDDFVGKIIKIYPIILNLAYSQKNMMTVTLATVILCLEAVSHLLKHSDAPGL